jgi:hypothetical protein
MKPKLTVSPAELTDSDIVTMLRSDNPEDRRIALGQLFPDGGAVMVSMGPKGSAISASATVDAGRMFGGVLYLAQQLGKPLGLQLNWVQPPEDPSKIVVAQPGSEFFK